MSLDFLFELPEFKNLLAVLDQGEKSLKITGVIDQAKPFFLSSLAQKLDKKIVYIQPSAFSLSRLEEQCQFFFSQFPSPRSLHAFPALADSPYDEIPPSLDSISSRMRFYYGLIHDTSSLVLTNLFGLLKPFPQPADLASFFLELTRGNPFDRDDLLRVLAEYGYAKEDLINSPGEYAWRGGIVDVFSPWQAYPFRIDFSGDDVASLREFDPSTQRSLKRIDRVILPSLREFPGSRQFLEEWKEIALKKEPAFEEDLKNKVQYLRQGEYFPSFVFLSALHREHFVPFTHYLRDSLFVVDDREEVEKEWSEALKVFKGEHDELRRERKFCLSPEEIFPSELWDRIRKEALVFQELGAPGRKPSFDFSFRSVPRFDNKIPFFLDYLKRLQRERERTYIYLSNQGVRQKLASLLAQNQIPALEAATPTIFPKNYEIVLLLGSLSQGFNFPRERISFFSEKDIFTEEKVIVSRPSVRPFISQFQDLKVGDHIVHTDYGVGIFNGLLKMAVDGKEREFIELIYKDDDRLFVPVEDLNLVQKYSKVGAVFPPLDKLGTPNWEKTKERTKKAVEKIAKELLELYARRKALQGFNFSPDGNWQTEFEKTFEYEETEDQLRSIKEVKKDMESGSPMDRLICGDVGYGKTEVAMRSSFKAVMDGKQVAVLCPTTVLASQHLKTFRNRMLLFPVHIEALTRLQGKAQQKKIVEDLRSGQVDIIIGTHRLLSRDVEYHNLGLLVVDEEQRFGVKHKEKIKQMKANIDVLTLTATPIPRTLNLSVTGLRDISLIETPPKDRLAVHTVVIPFSPKLITSAIKQELNRGGQVYYVHNRIEDIEAIALRVDKLIPQAKIAIIHGRMSGAELEKRMIDFISQKYNVLISTTIIENGIDIPLVNTLIVDRADLFGLAQLYQLRGRVGRSSRQAFAYFMVPPFVELTPLAKKRLKALKEFSDLGSGFRLAAKDLEIRGAGNLLGSEQHGNMAAVGFDYFMHLLEQTIKELKGEAVEEVKCEINLRVDIQIPEGYIPQVNLRLNLYKRLSSLENLDDLAKIREEIEDRFGPPPPGVYHLLDYGAIKFLAQKLKISAIDRLGNRLVFKFFPTSSADLGRLTSLLKKYSGSMTPLGVLSLRLNVENERNILAETIFILKELYGYTIMS